MRKGKVGEVIGGGEVGEEVEEEELVKRKKKRRPSNVGGWRRSVSVCARLCACVWVSQKIMVVKIIIKKKK